MKFSSGFKERRLQHFLALILAVAGFYLLLGSVNESHAADNPMYQAHFNASGKLIRPQGWREWIFVGSPPDGTTNAFKLVEDTSASTLHYAYTSGISVSATTHNFSVFIKSNGSTKIGIRESSGTARYATFDLINKSVISQTGTDAKIEELSNDWLRLSFNDITTTSTVMGVFLLNDSYTSGSPSDNPYTGDGTSGVYIYGAQLEEGSYATSYRPR